MGHAEPTLGGAVSGNVVRLTVCRPPEHIGTPLRAEDGIALGSTNQKIEISVDGIDDCRITSLRYDASVLDGSIAEDCKLAWLRLRRPPDGTMPPTRWSLQLELGDARRLSVDPVIYPDPERGNPSPRIIAPED